MQYFDKDFILFFSELEENNNKEWFQDNKKRYETHVKKPMLKFLTDVVAELRKYDSDITIEANTFIGRINNDIRFSKDKTPYKVRSFAHIQKGEKKDPLPVIAFQMGAKDMGIMSGFYNPTKERLKLIRNNILKNPEKFKELYSTKEFKEKFNSIQGEAIKRIPLEYQEAFKVEPLIANKQFFYVKEFPSDIILTDKLLRLIIDSWKAAKQVNDYLSQ